MSLSQFPRTSPSPVSSSGDNPRFLLPEPDSRERRRKGWSIVFSLLSQMAGAMLLLWLVRFFPPRPVFFYPISHRQWTVVRLQPPVDRVRPLPLRRTPPPQRAPRVPWRASLRTAPQPDRLRPVLPQPAPPAPQPGPPQPVVVLHPVTGAPPRLRPALRVDPPKVQVGDFGDPRGATAPAVAERSNVPRYGSFDSGSSRQAALAPPSAPNTGGFAELDGPAAAGGDAAQTRIRINSFDPPAPPHHLPLAGKPPAPEKFAVQPPLILSHPQPAYTALAQRNRVEGDVVLQAILRSDGTVRILHVIRGLGYGLDQSARAAAEQLRFRPALRNGQPVDWTVLLHISFRLAY